MSVFQDLKAAIYLCDAARVKHLLYQDIELREHIDDPLPGEAFGLHALYAAVQRGDKATIDVLLEAGANINKRTDWWAGGFGVLDDCDPSLAPWLMERGAVVDAHSASRLGLMAELEMILHRDAASVNSRGGDGQTPLHFACSVDVADLLLKHGAEIDTRDVDHESTPAQYMLRVTQKRHYHADRQNVARFLLSRGSQSDLLMAAALGDMELMTRKLDENPECIRMDVSDRWFPKENPRAGGTIYIWVLGAYRTAHTVARDFGHKNVFQALMERTPDALKLALACELGDETTFRELLRQEPYLAMNLNDQDKQKLPDAAQSNNTQAVRLMLEAGWPVDTVGQMGASALHWAAFNGNAQMARDILSFRPGLELLSREYQSTPLAWAIFGSGNSHHRQTGDFVGIVEALLEAGAVPPASPETLTPTAEVLKVLKRV